MYEFRLPDLGEGIHEGEVLKWHVKPGDVIAEDAPLVEVETDKAAVTIPSPKGGRVVEVRAKEGDTVRVGQVLVVMEVSGEEGARPHGATLEAGPASVAAPVVGDADSQVSRAGARRVAAAPATRRLARELGVDIHDVLGSGPGGRVTADDVRRCAEGTKAPTQAAADVADSEPLSPATPVQGIPYLDLQPLPDFARWGEVMREPVRSIRRKVARNTVTAMLLIPHVAHMDEADVTDLEAFRRAENQRGGEKTRLTLLAFVVRAVTIAVKRHPVFNASLDPFRDEMIYKKYYHIGIAVDTERGLIVPNLKDADRMSVRDIAAGIEDLARKAREGRLTVEELQGGTFTITNIGALGGTSFVPAIHYPEAAILGMGRVAPRPVVRDGAVVVRTLLPMTLSFDHRVTDGAEAARFVGLVRDLLEQPMRLAVEG